MRIRYPPPDNILIDKAVRSAELRLANQTFLYMSFRTRVPSTFIGTDINLTRSEHNRLCEIFLNRYPKGHRNYYVRPYSSGVHINNKGLFSRYNTTGNKASSPVPVRPSRPFIDTLIYLKR